MDRVMNVGGQLPDLNGAEFGLGIHPSGIERLAVDSPAGMTVDVAAAEMEFTRDACSGRVETLQAYESGRDIAFISIDARHMEAHDLVRLTVVGAISQCDDRSNAIFREVDNDIEAFRRSDL